MSEGSEVRRLVRMLMSQQARIESLERAVTRPQLTFSSIDDGTIVEKDATGEIVARVGRQPDGTHGVVDYQGPTPPAPTAPMVEGGPGLLTVTWDGTLTNARPLDLARIEAYAAEAPFEYIEEADLLGSITGRDGGRLTVTRTPGTWHVALVAVSRAEKRSPLSALVEVEVLEAGDSEAVERLAKAFHTDTRPPTQADVEGRPEGAYWTMLDATGAETARWRLVEGEWVDAPIAPEFIPEAYVDFLGANQGLIQQLMTHDVDLTGSLRAEQGTYGLELTAEGIEMSSQGLTYLGDRWFLPDDTLSYSALGAYIVASHDDPTRPPAPWSNYLALYDAVSGQEVRQIRSGGGLAFAQYHWVDPAAGWIWVSRIETGGDGRWQSVDMAAYDVMGTLVKTVPITAGIASFAANDTYVVLDAGSVDGEGGRMVYDHSGTLLWEIPYGEPRYERTPLAVVGHTLYDLYTGITSWDIPTQQPLGTTVMPGSGGHGTNVVGTDLLIPTTTWPSRANYLTVYDTVTGQITASMQIGLGGNKEMWGATRVGGSYYVFTNQDGLLATEQVTPFQTQQTQAVIDTITGGVIFNNPILRGVTKTEVTTADHLMASTGGYIEVRDRFVSQYGHNWFIDEAERDALLPHAWEGTEAITRSPVTTVWRMGRNQQWVQVWSEDQADTGWIDLQLINGWVAHAPDVLGVPGVRRIGNQVIFQGRVRDGATGTSSPIAPIPEYAPNGARLWPSALTSKLVRDGGTTNFAVLWANPPPAGTGELILASATGQAPNIDGFFYFVD